eukprot:TRINITY_DN3807_c0_g1_i2.p1 TRINITY_DN3807_c0_g1~~TRINITY_DN3807_c0_g1_i2.p1  ORF type:complete len:527 (+),score=158.95 TRINITY_DN3807_c0_g1_i2:153-1733(+)
MADPLIMLREFTKTKRTVTLTNDVFHFDSITFPRNVETRWASNKGEGALYTLDAIWFMLQQADLKYTDYLNECRSQNFPRVSLIDKRDLLAYLKGEIDTCPSIQPLPSLSTLPSTSRRPAGGDSNERASKKQKTAEDEVIQQEKRKLKEKLNAPKLKSIDAAAAEAPESDLGPGLSLDKIKQLKMKRLLHKRSTIADDEEEPPVTQVSKYMEADMQVTKDIINRERLLRTRSSILQSNKKHFSSIIDAVTKSLNVDKKKKVEEQKVADQKRKVAQTYDRYGDVQEDRFWKDKLKGNDAIEDFQIDTRGSFAGGIRPDAVHSAPNAAPSNSAPPPSRPKSTPTKDIKVPTPSKTPTKRVDKDAIPIIVVPPSLTTLLNMYNVKEFLLEGEFVPSVEKKNAGVQKESSMIIERKRNGHVVKYQVVENTIKLTPKEWNAVVAVFALGADWQFKGWKWSTPLELFSNVVGFYLRYEDEPVPPAISGWNVKVLAISKHKAKKHLAKTACMEFWNMVDAQIHKKEQFISAYH